MPGTFSGIRINIMGHESSLYMKTFTTIIIVVSVLFFQVCPIWAANPPTIHELTIPTSKSVPITITTGPDGAIWFTELYSSKIGRIDPSTHKITEYPTASNSDPAGITTGPDGALWFTEAASNKIARMDVSTHRITEYAVGSNVNPAGITTGPDNALWFTEYDGNNIGRIDPTTHKITEYAVPTSVASGAGIIKGPDGALWFTENNASNIARVDLSTSPPTITEFPTKTLNSGPLWIVAGPDGALWFTETALFVIDTPQLQDGFFGANQIGRIDPTTHEVTEYSVPTADSAPFGIAVGPDNALWFTEANAAQIGRIDPTTHAVTEYAVPTAGSIPFILTSGPGGSLWFTELLGNKIGEISIAAAGAPTAGFNANPTGGPPPLQVTFTDTSTGGPTSWSWTFGDGAKSILESPTHTYTKIGDYPVTLTVSNSAGSNSTSQTITVAATPPGAPTIDSVKPGNEELIVNFNFPSSNGGSPIASYTATATPGQVTAKGVGSPITLKGLVNGQTYQVTLTATNKAGGTSSPSSSVAGVPATTPTAPTDVAATAGNVEATVTFTASSSDGGSAITGYTAISSPKGGADTNASTTSTSHLVTGLKNGTKYTFTVDATNGVGTTASKPSKPVILPQRFPASRQVSKRPRARPRASSR